MGVGGRGTRVSGSEECGLGAGRRCEALSDPSSLDPSPLHSCAPLLRPRLPEFLGDLDRARGRPGSRRRTGTGTRSVGRRVLTAAFWADSSASALAAIAERVEWSRRALTSLVPSRRDCAGRRGPATGSRRGSSVRTASAAAPVGGRAELDLLPDPAEFVREERMGGLEFARGPLDRGVEDHPPCRQVTVRSRSRGSDRLSTRCRIRVRRRSHRRGSRYPPHAAMTAARRSRSRRNRRFRGDSGRGGQNDIVITTCSSRRDDRGRRGLVARPDQGPDGSSGSAAFRLAEGRR